MVDANVYFFPKKQTKSRRNLFPAAANNCGHAIGNQTFLSLPSLRMDGTSTTSLTNYDDVSLSAAHYNRFCYVFFLDVSLRFVIDAEQMMLSRMTNDILLFLIFQITHIAVYPGYKVTVLGTRMYSNPSDGPASSNL